MLNTSEILETINMIREENLDIRTITMGISLLDCVCTVHLIYCVDNGLFAQVFCLNGFDSDILFLELHRKSQLIQNMRYRHGRNTVDH